MHAILDPINHMTSHCYGDPSDRPIGDPDVVLYQVTARSVQSGKLLLLPYCGGCDMFLY